MARGRRSPLPTIIAVVVFVVGLTAAGAAFVVPVLFDEDDTGDAAVEGADPQPTIPSSLSGADAALAALATALETNDFAQLRFASSTAGVVSSDFEALTEGLATFALAATPGAPVLVEGNAAEAPIDLTWTFPGDITWTTRSTVQLENRDDVWLVRWEPSILEPSLASGDRLDRDRIASTRADILARDGSVLVGQVDLVQVGVRPSRVQDLGLLTAELERLVDADPAELSARIEAADPSAFVDVVTLSRSNYESIRDEIFPLPGTVFRESSLPLSDDPTFARAILGRSGEVTAEIIDANPGVFTPGDVAGLSGLQALYNAQLSGRPGASISVTRQLPDPSSTTTGTGLTTTSAVRRSNEPEVLVTIDPVPGEPLVTTIDPGIQRAAEQALDAEARTSALVAVEVSTGDLVAVANGPRGSTVNFAMTGQYPPGSIFKVVSGYALLRDTLDATTTVDCPLTITIDGRVFANAENEVLGLIPFRSAFAHSCNTAFVGATVDLDLDTLNQAGLAFGLGSDVATGAPSFLGSVPISDSSVDLAASAFGQGRVLFSPLSAAVMAATAADGTYRSPRLITSPLPGPQVSTVLEPNAASTLRALMRAVVTEGTGRAVAGVSGLPVSGKTGTAEFGNDNPPKSHAWFIGYQGNLAFAAFVEAGEFGGSAAAPLIAAFLETLAALDNEPADGPPSTDGVDDEAATGGEPTTTVTTTAGDQEG